MGWAASCERSPSVAVTAEAVVDGFLSLPGIVFVVTKHVELISEFANGYQGTGAWTYHCLRAVGHRC